MRAWNIVAVALLGLGAALLPATAQAQRAAVPADMKVGTGHGFDDFRGRTWWRMLGTCSVWYMDVRAKHGGAKDIERGNQFGRLAVERIAKDRQIPAYVTGKIVLDYANSISGGLEGQKDAEDLYTMMVVNSDDDKQALQFTDETCGNILTQYQAVAD